MAIKGTFNFKGLSVPNTHVKILSLNGGESGWNIDVGIFAGPNEPTPLETRYVRIGYRAGIDPIGDAEDKLLSEPEFAGFTRVTPKRISRLEFMNKFTTAERLAIRTAAKSQVAIEDYLNMVEVATFIDITRPDTIVGVQALEAMGLIATNRSYEILEITVPEPTPTPAP